eukprot:s80_g18.t1
MLHPAQKTAAFLGSRPLESLGFMSLCFTDSDKVDGAMSSNGARVQPNSKALEEFFQFLQYQLRLEAETCLESAEDLEVSEEGGLWQSFRTWVQPNLGKKEKWMPFHTVLGAHELFIVEHIHHNKELPWDEKRRFLAMFVFRAHCRSNVFREAQLPLMLQERFWRDPLGQFADNGPVTRSMLQYRRKTRQPLQTSAFLAIPERLCPDDDENLARNVAMRTRTLLEVAENVWPIVHNEKLTSLEKFQEISKTIQAGRRLGDTWSKMLMVSIDIAYPKLQLLESTCDVGVGAVKALQRLFSDGQKEDPRDLLGHATRAANSSKAAAAQNFWRLLNKVESLCQKHFAHLPLILDQVCTPVAQLSAVTLQVQLCEWRQFLDFLSKAGNAPGDEVQEDDVPPSEPSKKMRRIKGKQTVDEGPVDLQELSTLGVNGVAESRDSDDEMPLSSIRAEAGKAEKADANAQAGRLSSEDAYLQAAQQALGQLEAKVASSRQAVQEQELKVKRCKTEQEEAAHQAVEAMRKSREADEALSSTEIETSKCEYLLTASHIKMEVLKEMYGKLEEEQAKLSDGKDEVFDTLPALPKDSYMLPRLASAAKARMAHLERLMRELEKEADADDTAREPHEDQHAEFIRQGSIHMQQRAKAREAANKAIEAMRIAQERCKEERETLAELRLQVQLAEAQVLSLKQIMDS